MDTEKQKFLKYQGNMLKLCRIKKGYSRKEVCTLAGISPRTLASYETGTREPTVSTAVKLAKIYKVPFEKFMEYFDLQELVQNL